MTTKEELLKRYEIPVGMARMQREFANRYKAPIPNEMWVIADLADALELGAVVPSCGTCVHWRDRHPEADGHMTGVCNLHSYSEWRYGRVRFAKAPFEFSTRDDFACNSFQEKPQ